MAERQRTTKCGPITSEMSWRGILHEYGKLNDDFDKVMSLSVQERFTVMCAMFDQHRHDIIETMPWGLPLREFKCELYFRTYGERLPVRIFNDEQ